jgi:UDP-glucose 4-epimerase
VARANLVDALRICATHPAAAGETFLIRDGQDLSTAELVAVLRQGLSRPARLVPVPPALLSGMARLAGRAGLAERLLGSLCVDDAKLRRLLNWAPPTDARSGLRQMAKAFRQP